MSGHAAERTLLREQATETHFSRQWPLVQVCTEHIDATGTVVEAHFEVATNRRGSTQLPWAYCSNHETSRQSQATWKAASMNRIEHIFCDCPHNRALISPQTRAKAFTRLGSRTSNER